MQQQRNMEFQTVTYFLKLTTEHEQVYRSYYLETLTDPNACSNRLSTIQKYTFGG